MKPGFMGEGIGDGSEVQRKELHDMRGNTVLLVLPHALPKGVTEMPISFFGRYTWDPKGWGIRPEHLSVRSAQKYLRTAIIHCSYYRPTLAISASLQLKITLQWLGNPVPPPPASECGETLKPAKHCGTVVIAQATENPRMKNVTLRVTHLSVQLR